MEKKFYFKICLTLFIFSMITSGLSFSALKIVNNPAKPKNPKAGRIVQLKEVMRITDEGGKYFFKFPLILKVSEKGNIFLYDDPQLLKFDPNGKFLGNLMKEGQGPSEMGYIQNFILYGDRLIIHDSGQDKILNFKESGEYVSEFKYLAKGDTNFFAVGKEKYYFLRTILPGTGGKLIVINAENYMISMEPGHPEERLKLDFPVKYYIIKKGESINFGRLVRLLSTTYDEKNFYISHTPEYGITYFDIETNSILLKFNRQYNRVKVNDENKKFASGGFKSAISKNQFQEVPRAEFLDDIQVLLCSKDNLFVVTSTVVKGKGILVDVFDLNGIYVDYFYLKFPEKVVPYRAGIWLKRLNGDFIFTVETDEDDNYLIKKYRWDWK